MEYKYAKLQSKTGTIMCGISKNTYGCCTRLQSTTGKIICGISTTTERYIKQLRDIAKQEKYDSAIEQQLKEMEQRLALQGTKLNTTNIQQYTIGTPQTSDSDVLSLPDDMVDKTFVNKTDKITNKMLNILAANIELTLQISKNNETNLKLLLQRQQNSRRMEQITQQHGNKSWRTIR